MFLIILLVVIAIIIGYCVFLYNQLVTVKHNVDKAWSNIDVLLQQRHDELPKLVATCEGFMKHERELLTEITRLRSVYMNATSADEKAQTENALEKLVKSVFAVSENYPDLKSNENFMQLQQRISGLESAIADRREFFNASVNIYNIRIEQFPDVLIANLFSYKPRQLLEIPKELTQDVKIEFGQVKQ